MRVKVKAANRVRAAGYADVFTERESSAAPVPAGSGVWEVVNVFVRDVYIGQIVYYRRKHKGGGSDYGWMPEKSPRSSGLTDKHDAIVALLRMDGPARTATAARQAEGWVL